MNHTSEIENIIWVNWSEAKHTHRTKRRKVKRRKEVFKLILSRLCGYRKVFITMNIYISLNIWKTFHHFMAKAEVATPTTAARELSKYELEIGVICVLQYTNTYIWIISSYRVDRQRFWHTIVSASKSEGKRVCGSSPNHRQIEIRIWKIWMCVCVCQTRLVGWGHMGLTTTTIYFWDLSICV